MSADILECDPPDLEVQRLTCAARNAADSEDSK